MFGKIYRSLRSLIQRPALERDLDEEVRFHMEREIAQHVRDGMSPEAARLTATRDFGGVQQIKESCRDSRGTRWLEALWQDIRFGMRQARRPGFAIAAITVLALGIGANTAIFSAVHGVLLRPLPYEHGDRLVVLEQQDPDAGISNIGFSPKDLDDYRRFTASLDAIVEYHPLWFVLLGGERPSRVQTGVVSWDFFDVFGIEPVLGRAFLASEDSHDADAVLILSHEYWQAEFGGDPDIVGREFEMNDRPHTVVGVLPRIPQHPQSNDVYMPVSHCPFRSAPATVDDRNARAVLAFGRLGDGESIETVNADLGRAAASLHDVYPDSYPGPDGFTTLAIPLQERMTGSVRPTLILLLVTTGLVLLIACANVANLMLARSIRREREMAVRAAMGADRGRLVRQLIVESMLLTMTGGALGLLLAVGGTDLLATFASRFTPRAMDIAVDGWVLLFTLAVSILTGVFLGLLPAIPTRHAMFDSLKDGFGSVTTTVRTERAKNGLVIAQVAISFVLLIAAGLMVRSLIQLNRVDPGFDSENVLTMRLDLNFSEFMDADANREFFRSLMENVRRAPGVMSAAVSGTFPLNEIGPGSAQFVIEGQATEDQRVWPWVDFVAVSPDYFRTVGVPLIAGRDFTPRDTAGSDLVAIINESMVRHHWRDENPIGARMSPDGEEWFEIVGVVGDVKQESLTGAIEDQLYVPVYQSAPLSTTVLVRTLSEPGAVERVIEDIVCAIAPSQPVDNPRTLEQVRSDEILPSRVTAMLISLFAGLSVLITAGGIAGVVALTVSQRTHEIGIRAALGASAGEVLWMVMRQGLGLILIGLVIGVAASLVLASAMAALLFEVEPTDPLTFLGVGVTLLAVALAACFLPARRAANIDPMSALRTD